MTSRNPFYVNDDVRCKNCTWFGEEPDPISVPRGGQEKKWSNCKNPKLREGQRLLMQADELCFWEFGDCSGCASVLTVGPDFGCAYFSKKKKNKKPK